MKDKSMEIALDISTDVKEEKENNRNVNQLIN